MIFEKCKFVKTFTGPKKLETIEVKVNRNAFDFEKGNPRDIKIVFHIFPYQDKFFYYKEVHGLNGYVEKSNSLHTVRTQTFEEIRRDIYSLKHL